MLRAEAAKAWGFWVGLLADIRQFQSGASNSNFG